MVAYLGLAIPNFLLALVLLYINVTYLGTSVGGLFSAEYVKASWSVARFMDLFAICGYPAIILGWQAPVFKAHHGLMMWSATK